MLAASSRRTQKKTTLDIGDAEENSMTPSQLWKLKKNAMATPKTQHSVGANNKANPEAQNPGASLRPVLHKMDGTQQDSGNITVFGQHEGNSGDEHKNGTQDDFYPDSLNLYNPNLDDDNLYDNEDFNHQPDTQEKDFDGDSKDEARDKTEETAPSLLIDPHLDVWCLGLLLKYDILDKKIKLDNSYFLQYQIQMAWLLKKFIISIVKTSYGIFPKGTMGRWKIFVSQALKDSCLKFYYSNSKKALKNMKEFQCSIPVNGLLLVAMMIKGVITEFCKTGTDKVPDLSADKCRTDFNSSQKSVDSLVDNPKCGRELEEMLEEWAMTGIGNCYFDDNDNIGGSDMEDVNVIP
ncbi:hypothetical protein BDR06DRAFT_975915 [Suillus hirtellus]|nr:hypothetical protein BDR06DRAFT_975915 [Suillus hirtellus]